MNCNSCGSQLPTQAKACPNCGALTPYYYSSSGGVSEAPTVTPTPTHSSPISSGADPYSDPLQNPYGATPPPPPLYSAPLSTPLPSPPILPRRRQRSGIIIGMGLLVLIILLLGVSFFALRKPTAPTAPTGSTLATTTTTKVTSPVPAIPQKLTTSDAQKIYDQITSGAPTINDPMTHPDNYGWNNISDQNTGCQFTGGTYHATAKSGYVSLCYAEATNFTDFALQAQVTASNGHSGGLLFRGKADSNSAYLFRISTDGTYILKRISTTSSGQADEATLLSGSSQAIITGTNKSNLITVIVQKNNIYIYVNKKYLGSVSDSSYQSGQIGVYADADANPVDVVFSNVQVWTL